jgi:TonB family protein
MKLAWIFGIACAVLFHAGVLLFGGIFFMDKKKDAGTMQTVDLLSDVDAKDKEKPKLEEKKETKQEELEAQDEKPPDATELLRNLEAPPMDNSPALEAVSLGAIEAALNGGAGGGDFNQALAFSSGGVIGGTGTGKGASKKLEEAFDLGEVDQKARVIFQESPICPSDMRGKKLEGTVTVLFVVDASGKVTTTRVEKSSNPAYEGPAVNAIRKWKFEPGVRAGQPVASTQRITIRFPPSQT